MVFYSHVNYSVTKIRVSKVNIFSHFYSHVNYSVTKIVTRIEKYLTSFTVT